MSADLSADMVGVPGLSRSDQLGGYFLGAASSFPKLNMNLIYIRKRNQSTIE